MMEDNSDAQMETDVTSTTVDMPETQEISGSNGNVQMVILVEEIKDEDMQCTMHKSSNPENEGVDADVQLKQNSNDIPKLELSSSQTVNTKSPEKSMEIVEAIQTENVTPTKVNTMETQAKTLTPVTRISPNKTISSSMAIEVVGVLADSSSKITHGVDEVMGDGTENGTLLQLSEYKSDHPYAAKACSEPQPIVEAKNIQSYTAVLSSTDNNKEETNKGKEVNSKMDESMVSQISEKEASNDSQTETISESSEKDHNKSISRELKSLINSAKESKIISECTQLTSKTRKSRTNLDTSLTSLVEADKIQGVRRSSNNSQRSTSSEKSDKATMKRSMRSQNPEFVNKVKQFLNSVTGKVHKTDSEGIISDEEMDECKGKDIRCDSASSTIKKRKINEQVLDNNKKLRSDLYCWRCHWSVEQAANEKTHHPMLCTVCPRSFHYKCLSGTERSKIITEKNWVCPECLLVLHAESSETRSPAMKKISLGLLCELLKFALERMMDLNGVEPFMQPVDRTAFPDYDKYVVHPMDLSMMKNNINEGLYGSTEAFLADAQWILHNSIIFNTLQSKLTGGARALIRSCRTEMGEIEACPECYSAAHARRPTWFTDVCSTPHILLWAKLKGFPHWPAKGMSVNSTGLVDVRFFGAHDRAWVPAKDCYLYSEKDPNNFRSKRQDILDSMQEAEQHIRNISRKYGKFVYPPFKTQFDPAKLTEQLKLMIPSFEGEVRMPTKEKSGTATPQGTPKDKSRSNSKSSKGSLLDGDMSEGEEVIVTATRKMADGAEIVKEDEDFSIIDKTKSIIVDVEKQKNETFRKRRRSELEEAVITILDNCSSATVEKRMRCDDVTGENTIKLDEQTEKNVIPEDKPGETNKEETNKAETPCSKNNESTNNNKEKVGEPTTPKVGTKPKPSKTSTPKDNDTIKDKITTVGFSSPKSRPSRIDKLILMDKEDKPKVVKRYHSKNKFIKTNGEKADKSEENTVEKVIEVSSSCKQKKENNSNNNIKDNESDKIVVKKNIPIKITSETPKTGKGFKVDDDTSLAVIARVAKNNIINNNVSFLPTISSVRSLSITPNTESNSTKTSNSEPIEITVEETSSIFTPTSTDNVRNMKEAVTKLQKLRNESDSLPVGRVGVRAFARMTSPETVPKEKEMMQVEIKTEPIDLDDADRHNEKMDLMNAFKLRPVNPIKNNLREVRINKVVVSPIAARKTVQKPNEIRVRAKKTFPQPKKADDGRSELNGKNSMVYIPIQPPMTQAPIRGVRPITISSPSAQNPRLPTPIITTTACSINTGTAPLISHTVSPTMPNVGLATTNTCNVLSTVPSVGQTSLAGQVPTVGQATVHTVPLLTSLNGQWTFSLQPVMSVGGLDDSPMPLMNGISERTNATTGLPLAGQPAQLNSIASTTLNVTARTSPTPPPPPPPPPPSLPTHAMPGIRNETPVELPPLQQRPPLLNPLDASTPMGSVPPPSTAGPLTARLNQNAVKLTDFFRTLLEDSLDKIDEPIAQLTSAKLQLEQAKWLHQQEIDEIKHNHELVLAEVRASFEKEKIRAVNDVRRAAQVEMEAAVKLAKSKQWCANCSQEAQFYCCWNTSYCDYPCQRVHWSQHFSVCTQPRKDSDSIDSGAPSLDNVGHTTDNLPKSAQAPALTVGSQLTPVRVLPQDQTGGPKPSIIVSMMEDSSGNQTVKCLGTFKPQGPPSLSPLSINKQIMANEENAKKVVTSGGYLIVGGGSASSTSVAAPRRAHNIQYYT
ncbi:MYND-type zinc finger-containing chromatin reader ZMYND8-like isoform X2 [Battus philenor]|uniref:MYND-type zinc finger-containing chromatin reader ZMYND8-like isoform X2 n=1 Tax=Battus philenor TaxID=42288 RepID=UPI0035CFA94E